MPIFLSILLVHRKFMVWPAGAPLDGLPYAAAAAGCGGLILQADQGFQDRVSRDQVPSKWFQFLLVP